MILKNKARIVKACALGLGEKLNKSVWQKITKFCKTIILQLKNNILKNWKK